MVSRTEGGEYLATATPAYVDDVPSELEPTEVPRYITSPPKEPDVAESGARIVER